IFGSLVREYTDLFVAYVYAVLHSPSFRVKYKQQLSIDFPRIPMTSDRVLASSLATIGAQLVALHLGEAPVQQALSVRFDESAPAWFYEVADGQCLPVALTFVGPAEPAIEKVSWSDDTVWLDRAQTRGFQGVPEDVWQFHIGGYQVCEKWLKDRKGRTLSAEDITHYHRIVIALYETIRLMREIDLVIDEHGGWPDAFAGKS
ncbi:MAG TPA: type ISP restriction/modification enzyme, partial [Armatimonadota bacterium]|nr:type ISP restriction/modification enzyme [Armatimonadota bacterium]